ncbi:PepSY-associated TM helix domain-containing protein [Caulobacter endophyticus]|uniref:PepSY-associated TM helix domain-containing protein n=1 Tax=Caulobacter endophyticus TaxID=2172652 RepID=UPI0024106369|nr:PepSY domain-containing protein [Caulobacter endophyticus]MDG2530852.1 PepSY domain-containing protein [Caulobacter endophyticus]
MKSSTLRAWSWVHKWSSLVSTLFLLMLCVTGLPLVFTHEIEEVAMHQAWTPAHPDGPKLSLDQVLETALARKPGEVAAFMSFDVERPVVNVTTVQPGKSGYSFQPIDQTSGDAAPSVAGHPVMEFLLQLHTDMFLGLAGMLFLGAMGLLLVAALVSGVVLYAPFMRKLPFGTVRARKAARTRWLDYHNLLGAVTLAWVLVVGVTGVVNTLATPIIAYWKDTALKELTQAYDKPAPAGERSSLAAAVERAKLALPGKQLQFVAFPGSSYSTDHHYAVFFHGDTPLTAHLTTPALIDARTGQLSAVAPTPWYVKTLSLSQPLHFGDYGGLPLKILWALLDIATIVILGSGVYLWLVKRGSAR